MARNIFTTSFNNQKLGLSSKSYSDSRDASIGAEMKHQTNMENHIDFTVYFIQRSDNIHLFISVAEGLIAILDS